MNVINDLTSSLSSDLNSTELAKDLGLGFLAKSTAINGAVNLGIKLLEILFTLFLCWLMIRISSKLVNKFLRTQVQREKLSMSERKAKTLSTVTGSILKYVIYFIGLMSILKQLGVSSESLVVIASAGSVAIGLGAQSIAGDMMEGFFILFEDHYAVGDIVTIQGITGTVESVTLRSTKLRDFGGAVHIIPNGSIGTVTNNCREFINAVVTEINAGSEDFPLGRAAGVTFFHLHNISDRKIHTLRLLHQMDNLLREGDFDALCIKAVFDAAAQLRFHFRIASTQTPTSANTAIHISA